jgi:lipoate-protein ligase A
MEENDIPLVRRRSGGGTVYHASLIESTLRFATEGSQSHSISYIVQ